ncbi:MAG: aldose 1-epimerase family protein [Clostridia bacterium]|nr:aldose 1-epimerase family protein [Clostridia bacterium]
MNNKYIGHPTQLYGVKETRMVGGKADGMRLLEVRNGKGLEFTVSLDRAADIAYLFYKNNSMAYISPCGMVGPQYYDKNGAGFLQGFTAGFITTCGLTSVGNPCIDNGEEAPLHGNISYVPCEQHSYKIDENFITINAVVRDASIFGHQFVLEREYRCGLNENTLSITDKVKNISAKETPYMIMYHCNMGYPLLSENAELKISSAEVTPRNDYAAKDMDKWHKMCKPESSAIEQCYYHKFDKKPEISLRNPDIHTELKMTFDTSTLDCFTQWKMMGENVYVLGLEPANCYPDGRDVMREKGILKFLNPGEESVNSLEFTFTDI